MADPAKLTYEWDVAPGAVPTGLVKDIFYFSRKDLLTTGTPFTTTTVTVTPALDNLGGRACASFSSATAVDGICGMIPTIHHKFVADKQTRFWFSCYAATMTDLNFAIGFGTLSTTFGADLDGGTPTANYLALTKRSATNEVRLQVRKASGTAEVFVGTLPAALADAAWYDFEVVVIPHATIAGAGKVWVYMSKNGAAKTLIIESTIGLAIPDTVATSFGYHVRRGGTTGGSVKSAWGMVGYEQAR